NTDCGTEIIFDSDDTLTGSAALLPCIEGAETDGNVESLSPVSGDADTPLCHWYSPPGCFRRTPARL
ncbi:DUF957 domain-containing protein, partial [Salmonella enterica]|nr:DUF957 domain-containing protein [Salmonella enterica]